MHYALQIAQCHIVQFAVCNVTRRDVQMLA